MSVVPGLPDPPATHPASPERARGDCTECRGTGQSPRRGFSGSPSRQYTGSPGGHYGGSPAGGYGAYGVTTTTSYQTAGYGGDYERLREEERHQAIASHLHSGIGAGAGGIAGYRSPRADYGAGYGVQPYSPGHVPVNSYMVPPIHSSPPPGARLAASPGTPTPPMYGERLTGEGESPRRIRAWGAPHTLHGSP